MKVSTDTHFDDECSTNMSLSTTYSGYCAGFTPNPTYEEACSGLTGHTEGVRVVYNPKDVAFTDILRWFWEAHDPTSGMGQGNDRGTQYRSGKLI